MNSSSTSCNGAESRRRSGDRRQRALHHDGVKSNPAVLHLSDGLNAQDCGPLDLFRFELIFNPLVREVVENEHTPIGKEDEGAALSGRYIHRQPGHDLICDRVHGEQTGLGNLAEFGHAAFHRPNVGHRPAIGDDQALARRSL